MSKHLPFVNELSFFKAFPLEEILVVLNVLKERRLVDRELLVKEGDVGRSCFFLVEGNVRVFTTKGKHVKDLALLERGAIFGHMVLIDHGKRSATCAAQGDTLLLEMTWDDFDMMFNSGLPAAFKLIDALTRLLVTQLRATNDQFLELFDPMNANENADLRKVLNQAAASTAGFDLDEVEVVIPEGTQKWGR